MLRSFLCVYCCGFDFIDIKRLQWFSLPLQAILQEHCNHNVVNIVFWLASVMIVSNKPTKLLAMACKMQTVTGLIWQFQNCQISGPNLWGAVCVKMLILSTYAEVH